MTLFQNSVEKAQSPQAAMVILAMGIDNILARLEPAPQPSPMTLDSWGTSLDPVQMQSLNVVPDPTLRVMNIEDVSDTERVITLAKATEAKQEARRMFANQSLRLDHALGDCPDQRGWNEMYVIGGPLWLYTANRDLVMSYPMDVRARMVADLEDDDPQAAQEMGRDVLKFPGETGPGGVGMHIADGEVG